MFNRHYNDNPEQVHSFTCVRCGYNYQRNNDKRPYLCLRCTRFIAKSVYVLVNEDRLPRSVQAIMSGNGEE